MLLVLSLLNVLLSSPFRLAVSKLLGGRGSGVIWSEGLLGGFTFLKVIDILVFILSSPAGIECTNLCWLSCHYQQITMI